MKTRTILTAAFAVALVVSCSNDNTIAEQSDNNAIILRASLDKQTRAYNSQTDITSFKMYAFKTVDNTAWINNVDVTYNGSSCTWIGNTTWPGDNSGLNFYAYAPTTLNSGSNVSIDNSTNTITGFEQPTTAPIDLITAYQTAADGSTVTLTFKHALSKVEIYAINESNLGYIIDIKGVKIGCVNSKGDLTWQTSASTLPSWSNLSTKINYSYEDNAGLKSATIIQYTIKGRFMSR